jgi:hypothetical protein
LKSKTAPLAILLGRELTPIDTTSTALSQPAYSPALNIISNETPAQTPTSQVGDFRPSQEEMSPKKSHKSVRKVDEGFILGFQDVGTGFPTQNSPSPVKKSTSIPVASTPIKTPKVLDVVKDSVPEVRFNDTYLNDPDTNLVLTWEPDSSCR